jgi:hypothetical protein
MAATLSASGASLTKKIGRWSGSAAVSPIAQRRCCEPLGVHADLEHGAGAVRPVHPVAVPDPVVQEEQGPGLAHHVLLAADVLVAADGRLADLAQVGAGDEAGAAHLGRDRVRVVHDLDVEGQARVDGRVLVVVLGDVLFPRGLVVGVREGDVQEVVVEHRVVAEQAFEDATDQRQRQQAGDGAALRISLGQRCPRRHLGDGALAQQLAVGRAQFAAIPRGRRLAGLRQELGVDVVGRDGVEAQEAAGGEMRHLEVVQQRQVGGRRGHAGSIHFSKKNSYFR